MAPTMRSSMTTKQHILLRTVCVLLVCLCNNMATSFVLPLSAPGAFLSSSSSSSSSTTLSPRTLVSVRMNRSTGYGRGGGGRGGGGRGGSRNSFNNNNNNNRSSNNNRNSNEPGEYQCLGDSSNVNVAAVYGLLRERGEARRNGYYKVADRLLKELYSDHGVSVDDDDKTWRAGMVPAKRTPAQPYVQSEYSEALPSPGLMKQIQGLISERTRAKKSRDFDAADRIREQLRDNWNVYIEDRLRQWSVGGEFGPDHEVFAGPAGSNSKDDMGRRDDDYTRSVHSLATDDNDYIVDEIERRTQAKRNRDYATSDEIRDALLKDYDVHMNDRLRQWSVGGDFGEFGKDRNRDFRRRGGGGVNLSNDQVEDIASMLRDRIQAKKKRDFDRADSIRDDLRSMYSVQIDDKTFEWWVMSNEYSPAVAGSLDAETAAYVQQQLLERMQAKEARKYGLADGIRDDLRDMYGVEVDDRTREYTVEKSIRYYDDDDDADFERKPKSPTSAAPVAQINDEPATELEQEEESVGADSNFDLSTLTVVELKERLRVAGLKVSGKKAELIERLMAV